jgi:hypothetical protein
MAKIAPLLINLIVVAGYDFPEIYSCRLAKKIAAH